MPLETVILAVWRQLEQEEVLVRRGRFLQKYDLNNSSRKMKYCW
jgi:hypothetical protein